MPNRLLIALLCLVTQSTIAPSVHWDVGAWSPMHAHLSVRGAAIPPHVHPWETRTSSDRTACAEAPVTQNAVDVVCTADSTATGSVTAPIGPVGATSVLPAAPSPAVGTLASVPRMTSSFVAPVPLPPPIG